VDKAARCDGIFPLITNAKEMSAREVLLAYKRQPLLERELRNAMAATNTRSLPLYPEERDGKKPTTRRILDVFESIQRHQLTSGSELREFTTDLQLVHRSVLRLLKLPIKKYGQ
jgi:hypothetical protein